MNFNDLREEALKLYRANPALKRKIQDILEMARDEIEDGGSESHECELACDSLRGLETT